MAGLAGSPAILMSKINDLRRLALLRHRAATRKISRIKSGNGVEVSGSDYDPRKSLDFIRSASSRQLESYVRKLDAFNDRRIQFVPDAQFRPIKKSLWQEYQAAEAKRNAAVDVNYEEFKNIPIGPLSDPKKGTVTTVDDRMRQITPLHAHMANMEAESPYKKRNLSSTSVYSESKLQKLIKLRKQQSTTEHQKEVLKSQRDASMAMAIVIGELDIQEGLASLSNKQFALVWRYTRMSSLFKGDYEFYKDEIAGRKGVTNSEMVANDLTQIREYIRWAKGVKF